MVTDVSNSYPWSMTTTATPPVTTTQSRTLSIVALVLGGASIVFGQTLFLPLAAVIVGVFGYRSEPAARGLSVWGIVLGALAIFGWAILAIVGFTFLAPWLLFAL